MLFLSYSYLFVTILSYLLPSGRQPRRPADQVAQNLLNILKVRSVLTIIPAFRYFKLRPIWPQLTKWDQFSIIFSDWIRSAVPFISLLQFIFSFHRRYSSQRPKEVCSRLL